MIVDVEIESSRSEKEASLELEVEALTARVEAVEKARADAERRLAYVQSEVRDLEDSVSSITVVLDEKRRVIRWNPAAVSAFGRSPGHVLGRPFDELGLFPDAAPVRQAFERSMSEARAVRVEQVAFIRAGEGEGLLGMTLNPLRREGEPVGGFFILGKDITERVAEQAAALDVARRAGATRLASRIADELESALVDLNAGITALASKSEGARDISPDVLPDALGRIEVLARGMRELVESAGD